MTQPVDIEALRALMEKATTGGWKVTPSAGKPIISMPGGGNLFQGYIATWNEADLIVAAVNALPSLLTELEALRAERGRMVEGLQDARAGFEASQVLISALSNGHPSVMIETFIERIDATLKEPSQ
jgi:hypothetical protein